MLKSTRNWKY